MTIKLLTEHHFESLSIKGGCTNLSESSHVKTPHCWKSHVTAQLCVLIANIEGHLLTAQEWSDLDLHCSSEHFSNNH